MENGDSQNVLQSCSMKGGDDPHNYAQNSRYQRGAIDASKGLIQQSIHDMIDFKNPYFNPNSNALKIADFGCSIGPNTFIVVQNILEAIENKYLKETKKNPKEKIEFQVLFNDSSVNDFNFLFKSLPPRNYFAAGVPGSFHNQLFPKNSIHVGQTSYTLHWLSRVPEGVLDRTSSAWNRGNIQCTGFVKEVSEAYAVQFKSDLRKFLSARAHETVPGGLLFLVGFYLPDDVFTSQTWKGTVHDFIGSCLKDMASWGEIKEEKLESFNLPWYIPHASELKEAIEEDGAFMIEKQEEFDNPMDETALSVDFLSFLYRAVMEPLIDQHFGHGTAEKLFGHFQKKSKRILPTLRFVARMCIIWFLSCVILIKKERSMILFGLLLRESLLDLEMNKAFS